MGFTKIVTLYCDWEDEEGNECDNWTEGDGWMETVFELRQWAEERGWNVDLPGGHDLCPEHANNADDLDL